LKEKTQMGGIDQRKKKKLNLKPIPFSPSSSSS
jgi:hypothetical protein